MRARRVVFSRRSVIASFTGLKSLSSLTSFDNGAGTFREPCLIRLLLADDSVTVPRAIEFTRRADCR